MGMVLDEFDEERSLHCIVAKGGQQEGWEA